MTLLHKVSSPYQCFSSLLEIREMLGGKKNNPNVDQKKDTITKLL